MAYNQDKHESVEADLEMTGMMGLIDRDKNMVLKISSIFKGKHVHRKWKL